MLDRLSALVALCLALSITPIAAQDTDPFLRHPAVHPDGDEIAFSYQGDLWTVPIDGSTPERLMIHEAYEGQPRWGPEGNRIAFTSDRFGNSDLYAMDAAGSTPDRLTYHSTGDAIGGWTPDGRILFDTDRTYAQAEWSDEIYAVDGTGGTPDRLLDAVGSAPRMSPDGRFVAFERGYNGTEKKGYEGPADRNVWVYDAENDTYTQVTTYADNDHTPVWTGPRPLDVTVPADYRFDPVEKMETNDGLRDYAVAPGGVGTSPRHLRHNSAERGAWCPLRDLRFEVERGRRLLPHPAMSRPCRNRTPRLL